MLHETNIPATSIVLNRNYKPLGDNSRTGENWVDYDTAIAGHVILTTNQIRTFTYHDRERSLFDDGNPPWFGRKEATSYLSRLRILAGLL